jgi:hypothetical protein
MKEIITSGSELALYTFKHKYEDELKELLTEYLQEEKDWDYTDIKDFFREHTAVEYVQELYEKHISDRPEHYFKGYDKYMPTHEYENFLDFCDEHYYRYFEDNPDFLKNTITEDMVYFLDYKYINAILIDGSYSDDEIDIIEKFMDDRTLRKYFDNLAEDLSFNYEPDLRELKKRIAQYEYVIYYRGGSGYVYAIWGYKPSKKR